MFVVRKDRIISARTNKIFLSYFIFSAIVDMIVNEINSDWVLVGRGGWAGAGRIIMIY